MHPFSATTMNEVLQHHLIMQFLEGCEVTDVIRYQKLRKNFCSHIYSENGAKVDMRSDHGSPENRYYW